MKRVLTLVFLGMLWAPLLPLPAAEIPQSVEQLWADFDPRRDPLETEVIRDAAESVGETANEDFGTSENHSAVYCDGTESLGEQLEHHGTAAGMQGLSTPHKAPMHTKDLYPEHDLFIQLTKLKNTLRYLMGEEMVTHLAEDYE